ncbi:MAG: class I SAM-dependent methyltransferase [Candidatus Hermodarchaeia archaeon]|jgi:ubiquinone/menaquinone biosynthesis C-methylase UbiE
MMKRKAYFNKTASTWDERMYTPALITFLETLVPTFGLQPGHNILDLGTGTGILIPFLLQVIGPTGSVTGIDYAEKMVQICQSKYAHLPNVSILLQNVETLNFPENSFDAVTCFGLFPHLEKKKQTLNQIYHVLNPGGKLIIAHALSSTEIKEHHSHSLAVAHDLLPETQDMKRVLTDTRFCNILIEDKPGCYLCLATKPKLSSNRIG